MNKYTYEQKQIIVDYLENILLKKYAIFNASYEQETGISIDTIMEAIDDLKTLKYKSIQDKSGIKFKLIGQENKTYAIGYNAGYEQYFLIDLETFQVHDLFEIDDNEKVEVISE